MTFMPNIPFPVTDAHIFWNTIGKNNGWELQQNTVTGHCRILDRKKIRRAWGDIDAMERIFARMSGCGP